MGCDHLFEIFFTDRCRYSYSAARMQMPCRFDPYASKVFDTSKDIINRRRRHTFDRRPRRQVQDSTYVMRRYGGDVTIDDVFQWKPTIAQNPALLKIDYFVPWSNFVSDPTVKANLNMAINARIDLAQTTYRNTWLEVNQKRRGIPICPPGYQLG